MKVLVLNGPNLGRLGKREPEIYGTTTHAELTDLCIEWGAALGLEVEVRQTNWEGAMVDWLNAAADDATPVVLNAAAWTHYSYALYDACAQLTAPLVEVHISAPSKRAEVFRHTSVVSPHATLVIEGEGCRGTVARWSSSPVRAESRRADKLFRWHVLVHELLIPADEKAGRWQPRTTSRTAWFSTSKAASGRSSSSST